MKTVSAMRSVLFVDDENVPTTYYSSALEHAGFTVVRAKNPNDALAAARMQRFDLVILDVMMPRGHYDDKTGGLNTGLFLFPDIRQLQPEVPVMMLTNVNNEDKLSSIRQFEPSVVIAQKCDYPPEELVVLATELIMPPQAEGA
jgi:CheY-like chemotaxis protein